MTKREPSEWAKIIIGAFCTIITAIVIGLFVWVFNMNADAAVRDERIAKIAENQKDVIRALNKTADALNDLRVVIEGLKNTKEK